MKTDLIALIAGWLLTVALHGGLLLIVAWMIDRIWRAPQNAWRELIWRCALFGGVITASLQLVAGSSPLGGRWHLAATPTVAAVPVTKSSLAASGAKSGSANSPAGKLISAVAASNSANLPVRSDLIPNARIRASVLDSSRISSDGPMWMLAIWLVGALIALTRMARSLLQLRHAMRNAMALQDADLTGDVAALAQRANIDEPRLFSLIGIASPIAVTGARIVLPRWAIDALDRRQLHAMLAHELAHIARRDPQWKLLVALWRTAFWFLPLAALAQRRLDALAELACDAFAARQTGNARSVAECLAACAEHHLRGRAYALAPAMAVRESSLMHRIERLLEGVSMEIIIPGVRSRALALTVLAGCAFSLPAITFLDSETVHAAPVVQKEQAAGKKESQTVSSISIHEDDSEQKMLVSVSDAEHKFSANIDGKIVFNADETEVASLSEGGTASFEETRAGVTHRVEIAEHDGKLERRYFVDKHEQPFDAAAGTWFASFLPALIRETGIGAEARVQRLYNEGGAERVLNEIGQIHSDYVRGIYLGLLMDRGTLAPNELDRALTLAGGMNSDYERHQALARIFDKQPLSPPQQVTFLHQTLHFDSDYERAELLIHIVPKLASIAEVRQAWLDAALRVSSDYERRRTLEAMLTRDGLDDGQLGSVIEASASMGSDYEHRELLVAVAKRAHDIDAIAPAYARSTQALGSDYERREALLALMSSGKLDSRGAGAVLDSAAQIGSDYECREVLVALARVMPNDAGSIERYRQIAERLSENERREAESALKR